ncbi:MAG: hypothetical protein LR011_05280 [Verrucomicrobia bacterium]|nr:hypothetical protein [Verrucomicrobiota bacterium]
MKGRQFLVSLLTGAFGASAYLSLPMAAVGWIWPFLIVLGSPARLRDAFFHGWTVGSSFFGVSLYWLWNNPFPAGAVPGWFALSLYTGLYIGVWSVFCVHTWKSMCPGGKDWSRISYLCCFSSWPGWWQRLLWVIGSAGAWVALEWVRSYALTGFPWNLLGVSQASMPVVTWVAGLGGVLLVSWIVCAGSILLGFGVLQVFRSAGNPAAGIREAFPAFLIFIGLIGGFPRAAQDTGPSISVAAIQPGFTQWEIWNSEESVQQAMWDRVISLTDQALSSHPKPELVIWPEGAAPRIGDKELKRIANMAAENQTAFAVCLETFRGRSFNRNSRLSLSQFRTLYQ